MSYFDPYHVYSRSQKNTHKGQVLQKKPTRHGGSVSRDYLGILEEKARSLGYKLIPRSLDPYKEFEFEVAGFEISSYEVNLNQQTSNDTYISQYWVAGEISNLPPFLVPPGVEILDFHLFEKVLCLGAQIQASANYNDSMQDYTVFTAPNFVAPLYPLDDPIYHHRLLPSNIGTELANDQAVLLCFAPFPNYPNNYTIPATAVVNKTPSTENESGVIANIEFQGLEAYEAFRDQDQEVLEAMTDLVHTTTTDTIKAATTAQNIFVSLSFYCSVLVRRRINN